MKIAIIGAGITGTTAAKLFTDHGIDVDIFEKSRGLGGRLTTKRLGWGHIDIGAQYFTARHDVFKKQVEEWLEKGVIARWNFAPHMVRDGKLCESPDTTPRYVGTPSMNSIVHSLAKGITTKSNTFISALHQDSSSKWRLESALGEAFSQYDWVVSSLPSEQCTALFNAKTDILDKIPESLHQPCWAVSLATSGHVSEDVQGIFGDEVISWVSRLSSRPSRKIYDGYDDLWMLHFSPEWTHKNSKETDAVEKGFDWLKHILNTEIVFINHYTHYWRFASISAKTNPSGVLIDTSKKIAATGAWCNGGRVEGGYISALELVDKITKLS